MRDAGLVHAEELDRRAARGGLTEQQSRALRREAAELRRKALSARPYPVLVCETCLGLTGWLDDHRCCPACAQDALLKRTLDDPDANFDELRPRLTPRRLLESVRAFLEPFDRTWRRVVDPGRTGPFAWEEGFALDAAERFEQRAPSGEPLLRFAVRRKRFVHGSWHVGGQAHHVPILPSGFSSSLDVAVLAEAWFDYRQEVDDANRRAWEAEQERRAQGPPPFVDRDLGTPTWLPE